MTASSYNVCIYTQPKPLILCGNVFEGRVLKQSESYKRVTNYLCRLYSPLFTGALASTTMSGNEIKIKYILLLNNHLYCTAD